MKKAITSLFFLSAFQYGWSQIEMKLKPRFSLQKTDSVIIKQPFFVNNSGELHQDNMAFSHSVAAGTVYILRQDRMPCLKPDTTLVYNMPVQTIADNGNIPNAYRQNNGTIYLKWK